MRVIVTGAGGGIGQAVAQRLAANGPAQIVLVDRNIERGEDQADKLRAVGAEVIVMAMDATSLDMGKALADAAASAFGGIDALVVAAGSIANQGDMATLALEKYEAAFHIHTRPLFLLAQAAYPHLKASAGAIVAVSSTGAHSPVPGLGAYSASKAALSMLARQLALEWGPDGIRVNCVSPGPTATAMTPGYANPATRARRAATLPLRRICEPEDIAQAIAFLLSPAARNITGIDLEIDAGMSITTMQLSGAALGRSTG